MRRPRAIVRAVLVVVVLALLTAAAGLRSHGGGAAPTGADPRDCVVGYVDSAAPGPSIATIQRQAARIIPDPGTFLRFGDTVAVLPNHEGKVHIVAFLRDGTAEMRMAGATLRDSGRTDQHLGGPQLVDCSRPFPSELATIRNRILTDLVWNRVMFRAVGGLGERRAEEPEDHVPQTTTTPPPP